MTTTNRAALALSLITTVGLLGACSFATDTKAKCIECECRGYQCDTCFDRAENVRQSAARGIFPDEPRSRKVATESKVG